MSEVPGPWPLNKETAAKPTVMVHDYGLTGPMTMEQIGGVCQDLEAGGLDVISVFPAGAMPNPNAIANPRNPMVPAMWAVSRSRDLMEYKPPKPEGKILK